MVTTQGSSPALPSSPPNAYSSAISKDSSTTPRSSDLCHPNWHLQCQRYTFALARCLDLSPDCCRDHRRRGGVNSPALTSSVLAIWVKGQLSGVLQMVRVRANSLSLLPVTRYLGGIIPSSLPWHGRLWVAVSALLFSVSGLAYPRPLHPPQLTFFCMCYSSQVSRSFSTPVTMGPALSPATWGNGWRRGHLSFIHATADGSQKRFFQ